MTRKGYNRLKRATARIFSTTALVTGVCGIFSFDFGLILNAIVIFVGGLFLVNAIRDTEKVFGYDK